MSLENLLEISSSRDDLGLKQGLSEERIKKQLPELRDMISFYREYPDLLIDFMLQNNNPHNFQFYFYQRIFLRVVMRHRYVYATFPR